MDISKNAVEQKTKSEKLHINFEVIGDETTVIKSPSWSLEVVLSIWWVKEEAKPNGKLTCAEFECPKLKTVGQLKSMELAIARGKLKATASDPPS